MNNKGQVWIETVIYTLIGLAIIGILLAFIKPKINSSIDRTNIEKNIETFNKIDSVVNEIRWVSGNSRPITLNLKKGVMIVNSTGDELMILIRESNYEYSELGRTISIPGTRMTVNTEENNGISSVLITLGYDELNITYNGMEETHEVQESPTPYNMIISNNGDDGNGKTNIDIKVL
ncbi:hypothetical protein COU61_00930 [Candidatus Pacearchaeota archaeon CG10_big_fil_rev_8_21_14_0_10_35_13]|nr:MAG: hypothetical protein COU61_00930 [Candidatus Pacearchaeota archaeon CG10_big_fil_rev_8_21_14_0_10_35_13]